MPALNYAALRGLATRNDTVSHDGYYTSETSNHDRYYDQKPQYPEPYGEDPYHDFKGDYEREQNLAGTDPSSPYGERKSSVPARYIKSLTSIRTS